MDYTIDRYRDGGTIRVGTIFIDGRLFSETKDEVYLNSYPKKDEIPINDVEDLYYARKTLKEVLDNMDDIQAADRYKIKCAINIIKTKLNNSYNIEKQDIL